MYYVKPLLFFIFFLVAAHHLVAQNTLTVKGTVQGANGQPLEGVTILQKETAHSVLSKKDGSYEVAVPADAILVFTFVGYKTVERAVSGQAAINVVLENEDKMLNEVVVTALGISKSKRSLSYATQTVATEDITKARELNVANSLTGKVAGLDVTRSSSGLGGSSRIVLRGDRSITGNNQALIVVDGIPIDNTSNTPATASSRGTRDLGDGISSINPDDIESINVLKGGSATALYGSRAANGALIITTKKGRNRKGVGISYTGSYQIEQPVILQEFQNVYGQGSAGIYAPNAESSWGPKMEGQQVATWSQMPSDAGKTYAFTAQPDNVKDFYSNGNNLVNSVALNAGSEHAQVYFSYTNTNATGIVSNNKLKRHNFNLRASGKLGEKLSLDVKTTYLNEHIDNRQKTGDAFDNPNRNIYRMPRNIATADAMRFEYTTSNGFVRQNAWNANATTGINPYWTKNRNLTADERNRLTGFAALTYQIIPSLNVMLRTGMDSYTDNSEQKLYNDTYVLAPTGNLLGNTRNVRETNHDILFSYNKSISGDLSLAANFGGNIQKNKITGTATNNGALILENVFSTTNATALVATPSVYEKEKQALYATADLTYRNMLTLTVTGRNDWASTLPKKNNAYFFPSIGASAVLSDMFALPDFISFAKLRGSLAKTGSDAEPYNLTQAYTSVPGGNGVMVGRDPRKPIEDLKPEITTGQELGLDLRMLQSRLGIELTWYNSNSKNQLVAVALPPSSGWASQYINAGNVQNSGVELTVNGTIVKSANFKWNATVNYARNNNKVIEITPDLKEFILTVSNDFMNTVKVEKGKPYGELYSRGYIRNAAGQVVVNANGLPTFSAAQTVYLGNTRAKWNGSILNRVSYKEVYLSFVVSARMGGVVSSFTNANIYADGTTQQTLAGREGFIFDGIFSDGTPNNKTITAEQYWKAVGGRNAPIGEVFTYDASNIRLRELVLGYELPGSVLSRTPFQTGNISLTGRNLFFLLRRTEGFDPEMAMGTANGSVGTEGFSQPASRTYGVSLNFSF